MKHQQKRPGGELHGKPVQGLDGQWYDKFGNPISEDAEYARRFWDRGQPNGMRSTMVDILESSIQRESFGSFVDPSGITEYDKEKLSAYRMLAQELGYKIGKFTFNKKSYSVTAQITRL